MGKRNSRQQRVANRTMARKALQPSLVQQMLDVALETFEPHFKQICEKLALQAKAEGSSDAKFIVDFAAKYADRQDEGDARRDLMEMTRRLAEQAEYMPPGVKEQIEKDVRSTAEPPAEELLAPEEDRRVVESDLGAAPGSLAPAESAQGQHRDGAR